MTTAKTPRGVRLRNPGNLRRSADPWQGLAAEQTDLEFFVFETMPHGIRAMARVLISYQDRHGIRSVRRVVNRYAPPTENKTASYVDVVANRTGFRPDEELDLHTYAHLRPLVEAMVEVECGRAHGITAAQFDEGLRMAGVTPPAKPVSKEPAVVAGGAAAAITAGSAAVQALPLDQIAQAMPILQQMRGVAPWLPLVAIGLFGAWFIWTRIKARRDGLS
jgi:hypothetical protein